MTNESNRESGTRSAAHRADHAPLPCALVLSSNSSSCEATRPEAGAIRADLVTPTGVSTYWHDLVAQVVQRRKVVLIGLPLASALQPVCTLIGLGAEKPFVLAAGIGAGSLPNADQCEFCVVYPDGEDNLSRIRAYERLLAALPDREQAAVDAYDPEGRAFVVGTTMASIPRVAGRPVYGHRPLHWLRLEDKIAVDGLWEAAGVDRVPTEVVPAARSRLLEAAARLNHRAGTVWTGDAREGINGGGAYVCWVDSKEDADHAVRFLSRHCSFVRVMPFLEGIPCSIHGLVLPDRTIAFRPCEVLTLRRPGPPRQFVYVGCATYWDPPEGDRRHMRNVAIAVGEFLRSWVGYRGAFGIDGIMTGDGFRPTELNARFSAGLSTLAGILPDVPLGLLNSTVVAGEQSDYRSSELEAFALAAMDTTRLGSAFCRTKVHVGPGTSRRTPWGEIVSAPSSGGSIVKLTFDSARVPLGASVAPLVAETFASLDRQLGTDFGAMEAARDVRHPSSDGSGARGRGTISETSVGRLQLASARESDDGRGR